MKVHCLEREQTLPVSLSEAWEFFSDSNNLDAMTPPDLGFETSSGNHELMFQGQIIVHRIQLAPLVSTNWVTEITHVKDREYFIDEQRSGPYRFWHHLHRFEECEQGTKMLDRVHYALPFYPFGDIALPLVRSKLNHIFDFRKTTLEDRFGSISEERPVGSVSPTTAGVLTPAQTS